MAPPKLILFDLGGVIIENIAFQKFKNWLPSEISLDSFNEKWILSDSVSLFEKNEIDEHIFAERIILEFKLKLTRSEFLAEFNSFLIGYFPGAEDILLTLKQKYQMASFSNTNSIHWKLLEDQYIINRYFTVSFPSHKTGFIKPNESAFKNVLKSLNLRPDEILFFDDTIINVVKAKEMGFHAYVAKGISDVKKKLIELKILDA